MAYENIIVETKGKVGVIRLNRPQALNALNSALIADLTAAMDAYDLQRSVRPFVRFIEDLTNWYIRRSRRRLKPHRPARREWPR